jgi:hypothetical protein
MIFRSRTWPWVISIALHVAALTLLGVWAFDYYENKDAARHGGSGGGASVSHEPTPEEAVDALRYQRRRVSTLPADEKLGELKKRLDELDAIRFRNVRGAAGLVENVAGVKQDRWYRPNPDAKGTFDSKSATLFDVTRRVRDDKTVYVYTLVDAAGRTREAAVPADQMTPDDLRAYEVFEIARRNPKLRYLVESALRIGENMTREGSRE